MQPCANCGHQNRPGVVYCENCGASLLGKTPLSTKAVGNATEEEKATLGVDSSVLTDVKVQGVSAFSIDDTLRLEIDGGPEPIIFKPKTETIFGRRDPATGAMPDIDLTPYAGYRMGVSRRHAAIRQGDESSLNLWDLGSSNGTYLNGQKLSAHRPYRLHDGDELRLGQMMIRFHFQATTPEEAARIAEKPLVPPPPEPKPTGELKLPSAATAKPTDPNIKLKSGSPTAHIAPETVDAGVKGTEKPTIEAPAPKEQAPAAKKPAAPVASAAPAPPATEQKSTAAPVEPKATPAEQPKAAQTDVSAVPASTEAKPGEAKPSAEKSDAPPQAASADSADNKAAADKKPPVDKKPPNDEKKSTDEK